MPENTDDALWEKLETRVRTIASLIWSRPALKEQVNGVNLDCVLKTEDDEWVIVEVSRSNTLQKLREDLAKFGVIRPALHAQDIAARCFFVSEYEPSLELRESGKGMHVRVLSVEEFSSQFFDFRSYGAARLQKPFGSAVRPDTGERDESEYVPVKFKAVKDGSPVTVDDIVGKLLVGRRLILLGEFGTGKSRAFREIFIKLGAVAQHTNKYPVALNLREHWGARAAQELIWRHFNLIGLREHGEKLTRVYDRGRVIFMLDGFDEIGSQTWSDDQKRIRLIRQESVAAVRDLLAQSKGGAIISGREHYFNSSEEMFTALGLDPKQTEVIRCPNEFTHEEMQQFMNRLSQSLVLPAWLPRRPLICQTIASLEEDDLNAMFEAEGGDVTFWHTLMDVICNREARINPVLVPDNIKKILMLIARATRTKSHDVGPVSIGEINRAFEAVLHQPPVDESAIILQRLPGLGRPAAETTDREFIDKYILDGLRGLDIVTCVRGGDPIERELWVNPLQELGQKIVADAIDAKNPAESPGLAQPFIKFARKCANSVNRVGAGDVVGGLLRTQTIGEKVDFDQLRISEATIGPIDCSKVIPERLVISDSVLEVLTLPQASPTATRFENCSIGRLQRVSSAAGVPAWIVNPSIDEFETVSTLAQIKGAGLRPRQEILVAIIRKIFFQKGAGRKEEALLRGLERVDPKAVGKVVNLLIKEDIIKKGKGDEGVLYRRVGSQTHRMKKMLAELTLSKDPLWLLISSED